MISVILENENCRYYGKSKPYRKNLTDHMQFLTSEQAMADYAELLFEVKDTLKAQSSPVIGFGGSYGVLFSKKNDFIPSIDRMQPKADCLEGIK